MLYELIRPLLFRFDPETAHSIGLNALHWSAKLGRLNPLLQPQTGKPRRIMGLEFPNLIGLAAGMDKNGDCIDGLAAVGFGFLEIGTVTPLPQPGNPKPRLFRLVEQQALINRLGFNNKGVFYAVERVKAKHSRIVIGINIGKNLSTPVENALEDYLIGLRQVHAHADYVAVNISSPNTPGLRKLQTSHCLDELLDGLESERQKLADEYGRRTPLAVKIAPDLEPEELAPLADLLVKHRVDAVIATNTTLSRVGVEGSPFAQEAGGLSGKPLLVKSTQTVARLSQVLKGELPIIACGGIFSVGDARDKLEAGASLVQIYTGFIYRGPALVREIAESL